MSKAFHLEILSPERTFYNGDCVTLMVPISDGMLGIMAGHTPLTAAIVDGEADDLPEWAFFNVGTLEDARQKAAEKLAEEKGGAV